jgi:hypothetical protein
MHWRSNPAVGIRAVDGLSPDPEEPGAVQWLRVWNRLPGDNNKDFDGRIPRRDAVFAVV